MKREQVKELEDKAEVNHAWNILYMEMRKLRSCDLEVMANEISAVLAARERGE